MFCHKPTQEIKEAVSRAREIEREARAAEEEAITKAKEAAATAEATEALIVKLEEEVIKRKTMLPSLAETEAKSVAIVSMGSIEEVIVAAISIERASRAAEEAEIAKAEEASETAKAAEALLVALEEGIGHKKISPTLAETEKIIEFNIAFKKAIVAAKVAITKAKEAEVTAAAAKELLASLKKSINHKIILPELSEKEKIIEILNLRKTMNLSTS